MLDIIQSPDSNYLEIILDGDVSRTDFNRSASILEQAIQQHGQVRVLEVIKSIGSMELSVMLDDIKFGLGHMNDLSRCAIVTDQKSIELFTKAMAAIAHLPVKVFHFEEIDQARAWLEVTAPVA